MAEERTKPSGAKIARLKKRIRKPGENPYARVCVYGPNGSGKTRFATSADKTLLIDINEEGDRSIKGRPGVRVFPAGRWGDIGDCYWMLKSGEHPFEVVALDTVTQMNAMAIDFVLGEAEERDPTREKAMPDKRTYGRAGKLMMGMMLAYRNLPMHVVFCAQERRIRDQDTEELLEVTVDLPAGSRGTAMGSVGVLGRMVPREVRIKRKGGGRPVKKWRDHLVLGPHEIVQTKDRTFSLGNVLPSPTMPKVIEAWQSNPPKED